MRELTRYGRFQGGNHVSELYTILDKHPSFLKNLIPRKYRIWLGYQIKVGGGSTAPRRRRQSHLNCRISNTRLTFLQVRLNSHY